MYTFSPQNTTPTSACTSDNFDRNHLLSCSNWVFDDSLIKTTAVQDFQMICDHKQRKSLNQTFYMVGMLIGRGVMNNLAHSH